MRPLFLAVAALALLLVACDKILGIPDNYVYCGPDDDGECGGSGGGDGTAGSAGASGGSAADASPDAP